MLQIALNIMFEISINITVQTSVNVDWETIANIVKIAGSMSTVVLTHLKIKNIKNSHDRDNRNHD